MNTRARFRFGQFRGMMGLEMGKVFYMKSTNDDLEFLRIVTVYTDMKGIMMK